MSNNNHKIVCTIGPATIDKIEELVKAGMTHARVNCSHGGAEGNRGTFEILKKVRKEKNLDFVIMLDTKGPDVRIGKFKDGGVDLDVGQTFTITTDDCIGTKDRVWVQCEPLPRVVKPGQVVLLSDGKIRAVVTAIKGNDVITKIELGGRLTDRKTLFAPNCDLGLPFMADYDKADLKLGKELGMEMVAASFVGSAKDIQEMKEFMRANGGEVPIIAKIESSDGIKNLEEILDACDGIMVARGDLGVEFPLSFPFMQRKMLASAKNKGKFSIVATEMMESMITTPRPTRAEVTDITLAIWQGADATMLSAETAVGKFPVEAVQYMKKIQLEAARTDADNYDLVLKQRGVK